jgi:hypothetical protein
MDEQDENQAERKARLPYEPPAVISEEVFETLALSCAKANPLVCPGGNPDRS